MNMLKKLAKHLSTLDNITLKQVVESLPSEDKLKVFEMIMEFKNDSRNNS